MRLQNGAPMRVRSIPAEAYEFKGRLKCLVCSRQPARGVSRPYCLEHGPYAEKVRADLRGPMWRERIGHTELSPPPPGARAKVGPD